MSGNSTNGGSKRIVPSKFAHAVLRTNKFKQMWDPLESTCRHASLSIL